MVTMWIDTKEFADIAADGRWKVEFFSGIPSSTVDSVFDLVELWQLVEEAKGSVDPQEFPEKSFNYLSLEHVESLTGDLVGFEPRPGKEIMSRAKVFREGNILYGRLRPYLNKVFVADGKVCDGICSGEFYVLEVDYRRIRPYLLRHILASEYVVDVVARFQSGAALPRVPLKDLLSIRVPVPPLERQNAIESYLRDSDDLRRRLRQTVESMPQIVSRGLHDFVRTGRQPEIQKSRS